MIERNLSEAENPDLAASLVAIRRAAAAARKLAIDSGTGIVVERESQTVRITAEELRNGLS